MQPGHEGHPDYGWQLRWLWWTFLLATLAVALLIPAYRIGDPFEDPAQSARRGTRLVRLLLHF
jgi:hypothetical protein